MGTCLSCFLKIVFLQKSQVHQITPNDLERYIRLSSNIGFSATAWSQIAVSLAVRC